MPKSMPPMVRKLLLIPPVLVGIGVVVLLLQNRAEPQRKPEQEVARVMRVMPVPKVDVLPRALGFGTAEPGHVWQAVVEVKGRVIEVHPELKPGAILQKDDVVLKIDPAEYDLAIARIQAEIDQAEAQLEELDARKQNDETSIKIERQSLAIAEKELKRFQDLYDRKAATASDVEKQQQSVLTQRQSVQSRTNSLNLIPSEKKATQATIAVKRAQLAQARLDRKKTVITAPFGCRVGPVSVEVDQFLATGQTLFEAHGVDLIEVEAQMTPHHIRRLLRQRAAMSKPLTLDMATMRDIFQFDAIVRFDRGDAQVEWDGKFARIRENINPQTQTIGIVIAIDKPYERAVPGRKPPPVKGTFCEVELRGTQRRKLAIVPRSAVHNEHVYVVDAKQRLQRRKVQVAFTQSGFVAIESGLEAKEIIVVSDPTPAVEGMLVDGVTDERLAAALLKEANGDGDVR